MKNQPLDLDLYGYGWDQYRFSNKYSLLEKINKITPLMKLFVLNMMFGKEC